jgi:MoaA/NifB/PqqE/SkfB family radical SAM enzyme
MNTIYSFLKLNRQIRSTRVKLFGIWMLHCMKQRYFGLFLDPVLACNLRCRMCYFSDENKRKNMKGALKETDLPLLARAFFHRALKLQIGCGAEPSLFRHNRKLIELAKSHGVPYISMTTNGNLLSKDNMHELVAAGLDEITLSLHGITQKTYEYFMQGASFDKFLSTMECLTEIKSGFPSFKVRLNYTVNQDNLMELQDLFSTLGQYKFDILQIRPIQQIGDTDYCNFSWDAIYDAYDRVLERLKIDCLQQGITLLMPEKKDFLKTENKDARIADATYFYVRPGYSWQNDFDLNTETYETYSRRKHFAWSLLKEVFSKPVKTGEKRHLNYEVS